MKKVSGIFFFAAFLLSAVSQAAPEYIWTNAKGFQSASKCEVLSQKDAGFKLVKNSKSATSLLRSPKSGKKLALPDSSLVGLMPDPKKDGYQYVLVINVSDEESSKSSQKLAIRLNEGFIANDNLTDLGDSVLEITTGLAGPLATKFVGKTQVAVVGSFWQMAREDGEYVIYNCGERDFVAFDVFAKGSEERIARVGVSPDANTQVFRSIVVRSPEDAAQTAGKPAPGEGKGKPQNPPVTSTPKPLATATPAPVATPKPTPVPVASPKPTPTPIVSPTATPKPTASPDEDEDFETGDPEIDAPVPGSKKKSKPSKPSKPTTAEETPFVVCTADSTLQVRNKSLSEVLFAADRLEAVKPLEAFGSGKKKTVEGVKYTFIKVRFPGRASDENTGWIAQEFIKTKSQCLDSNTTPKPPTAPPVPPSEQNPSTPSTSVDLLAPNCAETKILAAAKKVVANEFDNSPTSGGLCALGVRKSLQKSGVGDVTGGLGNAIDYLVALKDHGFVDSGLKDISKAPAGAVLVFSGPNTKSYLKNGHFGSPAGNWLGHVTIKGGDGYYYTDGRTREPAIGWKNGKNVSGIRNLAGIFVPGPKLIKEYANKCN